MDIKNLRAAASIGALVFLAGCGVDGPMVPEPMDELPDPVVFVSVSVGGFHACGVTTSARVSCWGENAQGQLGTQNTDASPIPVPVASTLEFAAVAAGGQHTCALTTDGELHCWGSDAAGQLGRGTGGGFAASPLPVVGGFAFRSVSASSAHTCGITTTGAAYCWGVTESGRLGTGGGTVLNFEPAPLPVQGGHSFTSVVTGASHTCGLVSSESYCWGRGTEGQIGQGMLRGVSSPTLSVGGHVWQSLTAGAGDITCAIGFDGEAYCWGDNAFGQAGSPGGGTFSQPTLVGGGLTFATNAGPRSSVIAVGPQHSCALAGGGKAYCWGNNQSGQLGTGNNASTSTPLAVTGGLNFQSLEVGGSVLSTTTCGLSTNRVLYCWGSNAAGQLGQFDVIASSTTPLRVFGQAAVSSP